MITTMNDTHIHCKCRVASKTQNSHISALFFSTSGDRQENISANALGKVDTAKLQVGTKQALIKHIEQSFQTLVLPAACLSLA